jgi:hypothetical protein
MPSRSRFDAEEVERLATVNRTGRLEMRFRDRDGHEHILSLPVPAAIALGRLICDVEETAPFLLGVAPSVASRRA